MRRVRTRRRSSTGRLAGDGGFPPVGPPRVWQARAWCGPAHGMLWQLTPGAPPVGAIDLVTVADGAWTYRLVVHPLTHRPARDHQGRFVYLPVVRLPRAPDG